ncbi:MAG: hypothetical protein F4Y73_06135, partial [Gemmatimonadetes bacterium]|nr:hypothetical protein [Gemmatimonadota bacterium]
MKTHRPGRFLWTLAAVAAAPGTAMGQASAPAADLEDIADFEESSLAQVVERFSSDLGVLERRWGDIPYSAARQERMRDFLAGWAKELDALRVASDDVDGSIDLVLLGSEVRYRQELLAREGRMVAEVLPLLPFADDIVALLDIRHSRKEVDGQAIAGSLAALAEAVDAADRALRSR